ncbi:hypothetical protein MYX82_08300 [Acidobacteria bacterium AH-259-D05]|nr:hypothetical protein [Acidobacteria bacterium AH-259-D05]
MRIYSCIPQDHSPWTPKSVPFFSFLFFLFSSFAALAANDRICLIITGLGGMPEYEENFLSWGSGTETVFRDQMNSTVYYLDGRKQKKPDILQTFNQISSSGPFDEVWIFLIGHASHDNRHYKFNISGPDLTDDEIKAFLDSLGDTRVFLIAATSTSGILASKLSQENRVIITATKSEFEKQPPLFMSFFLEAITSTKADTDKSGRVSLLEAYLFSHQKVADWFEEKGRIQTEHSLLEDNGRVRLGEKQGTLEENPSSRGTLLASMAYLSAPLEQLYSSPDAEELASQRVQIEREIEDLKFRKNQLLEDEYYRTLEELLIKLATMSERIEQLEGEQ